MFTRPRLIGCFNNLFSFNEDFVCYYVFNFRHINIYSNKKVQKYIGIKKKIKKTKHIPLFSFAAHTIIPKNCIFLEYFVFLEPLARWNVLWHSIKPLIIIFNTFRRTFGLPSLVCEKALKQTREFFPRYPNPVVLYTIAPPSTKAKHG